MPRKAVKSKWFELVLDVFNPVLVMGAVGSLTFFLIDVGYAGQFDGQLRWTFFFFVFGAVLASRIALLMGSERGFLYGLILGGVTLIATAKFVNGIGWIVNLAIIGVIAAASYVLVRDSTLIDANDFVAGRGILAELSATATPKQSNRRRGLWVVYFTLAAWAVFVLGQSLIPANAAARRSSALQLMMISVGCAMGLLLTTALLSLRDYLRTRRLSLPMAMTARWLTTGALIIVFGLGLALFAPRPHPEFAAFAFAPLGSVEREASKHGPDSEAGGDGDGRAGAATNKSDSTKKGDGKGKADPQGKDGSADGKKGRDGKKKSDAGEEKGESGKDSPSPPQPSSTWVASAIEFLRSLAQIAIAIMIIVIVLYVVLRNLAGTQAWAMKLLESISGWWNSLFGGHSTETEDELPTVPPRAFESFANPFTDGSAARKNDAELVRYTFTALEAWARNASVSRAIDETPLEFATRIGSRESEIRHTVQKLGSLYALVAYTRRSCPPGSRVVLQDIWLFLERIPASTQ